MKLYLHRFIHHIGGLPDFSALKFTRYNQYESLVLPLYQWLLDQGVVFQFRDRGDGCRLRRRPTGASGRPVFTGSADGPEGGTDLGPDDLLFMTIGSLDGELRQRRPSHSREAERRARAGLGPVAAHRREGPVLRAARRLWRTHSRDQVGIGHGHDARRAHPRVHPADRKRDPFSGKVVTGGIVTAEDSSWLLSWTVNRQPHFKQQPKDQIVVWVYSLFVDTPGDYVKKHDARVHRRRDHQGMALPSGRPRRRHPRTGRDRREDRAGDDAVRHVLLHAPSGRRPP